MVLPSLSCNMSAYSPVQEPLHLRILADKYSLYLSWINYPYEGNNITLLRSMVKINRNTQKSFCSVQCNTWRGQVCKNSQPARKQVLTIRIRNSTSPCGKFPETEKRECIRTPLEAFPETSLGGNRRNSEDCNLLLNLFVQGTSWLLWSSSSQSGKSDLDQNPWTLTKLECTPRLRFLWPICPAWWSLYPLHLTDGFAEDHGLVTQGYCQVQRLHQTALHFWSCGQLEL